MCIVDNLIVSGATVLEVAKVLRKAGARRIYAVAVARPPSPGDPPSQAADNSLNAGEPTAGAIGRS
jgi:adenine/guanine phosphoribosyltransferase-like PRPP-binding protein